MAHSAAPSHNATRLYAVTERRPPSASLHTGAVLRRGLFRERMKAASAGVIGGDARIQKARDLTLVDIRSKDRKINN